MRRVGGAGAIGAAFLTLCAAGCDAQVEDRHWTVRDSAGVPIVENEAPGEWGPASWSLSPEPVTSVRQDESDPDRVWTYIRRVFWFDDGRIGVGTADPPFLRIFSADGEPAARLGEEGEGPGELRAAVWAGARGDSALIQGPGGLSLYDPDGLFVRRIPFHAEREEIFASTPSAWIVRHTVPYDDEHGAAPPQVTAERLVLRVDGEGEVTDTLGRFEQVLTWRVQSALWGTLGHLESDGRRVYEMDSREFEIRVHEGGGLARIIRAPVPTLDGFTDAHFEAVRRDWGDLATRFVESDREAGRFIVPPAVAIRINEEAGELWVRRTDDGPQASARVWDVFDEEGVWTATVETPAPFSIEEIRGDRVLGIWTNELDVTSVHAYEVRRGG